VQRCVGHQLRHYFPDFSIGVRIFTWWNLAYILQEDGVGYAALGSQAY
jgi:hypothetical protein